MLVQVLFLLHDTPYRPLPHPPRQRLLDIQCDDASAPCSPCLAQNSAYKGVDELEGLINPEGLKAVLYLVLNVEC